MFAKSSPLQSHTRVKQHAQQKIAIFLFYPSGQTCALRNAAAKGKHSDAGSDQQAAAGCEGTIGGCCRSHHHGMAGRKLQRRTLATENVNRIVAEANQHGAKAGGHRENFLGSYVARKDIATSLGSKRGDVAEGENTKDSIVGTSKRNRKLLLEVSCRRSTVRKSESQRHGSSCMPDSAESASESDGRSKSLSCCPVKVQGVQRIALYEPPPSPNPRKPVFSSPCQ